MLVFFIAFPTHLKNTHYLFCLVLAGLPGHINVVPGILELQAIKQIKLKAAVEEHMLAVSPHLLDNVYKEVAKYEPKLSEKNPTSAYMEFCSLFRKGVASKGSDGVHVEESRSVTCQAALAWAAVSREPQKLCLYEVMAFVINHVEKRVSKRKGRGGEGEGSQKKKKKNKEK